MTARLRLTATTVPPHGPCFLSRCADPASGYVIGADPAVLVCTDHTGEVERTSRYTVRPLPEPPTG
jgi:hypothetical protein